MRLRHRGVVSDGFWVRWVLHQYGQESRLLAAAAMSRRGSQLWVASR